MDTTIGFTSLIPWSWLWRRGIVLLLVGVVLFSLLFSDPQTISDPAPIAANQQTVDDEVTRQTSEHVISSPSQGDAHLIPTPFVCSDPSPCPPCPDAADSASSDTLSISEKGNSDAGLSSDPLFRTDYKRRLAETIAGVQRQIARVAGRQVVVDSKWALTLGALVEELDSRISRRDNILTNLTNVSQTSTNQTEQTALPTNMTRHVCPEVYMGKRYDHPFYQHGMEMENCTQVPNFSHVLSAILPAQSWPPDSVNFVVSKLRQLYDIPIIALVSNRTSVKFKDRNVKILLARRNYSEATLLNGLVKLTKTPYVFLGTSLAHFTNQSSLERLVRILDDMEHVKVVGGAARDYQGHWIHGCLQQHMGNYKATYKMGYYYSKHECMYCDDLLTPFVTTKSLITQIPFTNNLSGPAIFRDWFAKVREAGHLAMACPDVMFFVSRHATMSNHDWQLLARQWALQDVHSYTDETFSFDCDSINIKCDNVRSITKSLLLPPCCIAKAHRDIGLLADFAESRGLQYELQAGSVLGAVKFGSFLPWDMDHDVYVECKDFKTWTREFGIFSKTFNCTPKVKYKNAFLKILCHSFTLDIFCRSNLSKIYLPQEYQEVPTAIWYGGSRWTKVMSNPGLFSRNSIGFEHLKHLQHSTHLTELDTAMHEKAASGSWLPCKMPKHHSCLDRYPADGNLPFIH